MIKSAASPCDQEGSNQCVDQVKKWKGMWIPGEGQAEPSQNSECNKQINVWFCEDAEFEEHSQAGQEWALQLFLCVQPPKIGFSRHSDSLTVGSFASLRQDGSLRQNAPCRSCRSPKHLEHDKNRR